jgi:dTDP-4-amino-4,6-dideoxygalactose transaminase
MKHEKIFVTRPYLPELSEFIPELEKVWDSQWITNNGQLHQELEQRLCEFLDVPYISLFTNGTLALITALQVSDLEGEVITTPYSFVATTQALIWNNLTPVFCDVRENDCNIDPGLIEKYITPKTSAILPVHVYGYPCNVKEIQRIADENNLKVIYDGAHAFGASYKGKSLLSFGDLSILSFHATKVYNTFEGGAIISHDKDTKDRIDQIKNFGYDDTMDVVVEQGYNAKMNEVQSAMGLLQLRKFKENTLKRSKIDLKYRELLKDVKGISIPELDIDLDYNYAYFPIFIDEVDYAIDRNMLLEILQSKNIYARKYFYPLISNFKPYNHYKTSVIDNLPVANRIADEVLCLPIYPELAMEDVERICEIIRNKA